MRCGPSPEEGIWERSIRNVVVRESALSSQGNRCPRVTPRASRTRRRRRVPSRADRRPRHPCRLPSPVEMGSVRIGVIASIAHRLPPALVRPVGAVRLDPRPRASWRAGHDVTLFATADSHDRGTPDAEAPPGYEEDPTLDAKVCEALHIAAAFERAAEFDVISQPVRLPAADLQPARRHARGHDRSTASPRSASCPSTEPTTTSRTTSRSATPTGTRDLHLRGDDPPRHRPRRRSPSARAPADTCCSSVGSTPTRAPTVASTSPARAGLPLVIAGIVQDEDYFEPRSSRTSTARRSVRRPGRARPSVTPCWAARVGAAAPHRLRRAVRPLGGRGARHRHPGDRLAPRLDAGADPRPAVTGFLAPDHTEAVRAVARLPEIDRAECRADAETRFGADRMVDDYIALFQRLTSGSDPGTVEVQG